MVGVLRAATVWRKKNRPLQSDGHVGVVEPAQSLQQGHEAVAHEAVSCPLRLWRALYDFCQNSFRLFDMHTCGLR